MWLFPDYLFRALSLDSPKSPQLDVLFPFLVFLLVPLKYSTHLFVFVTSHPLPPLLLNLTFVLSRLLIIILSWDHNYVRGLLLKGEQWFPWFCLS